MLLSGAERDSDRPARILAVGGVRGALDATLAHPPLVHEIFSPLSCVVTWVPASSELPLSFDDDAFDCVVAVDYLPLVAPSERRLAVEEMCRVARTGVVLSSPFNGHSVVAAERAVNDLHRAATGADHPEIGRHIEFGLPDLDATREWASAAFAYVETRSVDHVALWQAMESMAVFDPTTDSTAAVDAAGAAAFPPLEFIYEAEPAYRTLVVAAAHAAPLEPQRHWSLPQMRAEFSAMQMHMALEAAAQRQAFDRLADAVTSERERERDEFRKTVASLAAELHEREAQLELLERELAARDRSMANQSASIAILEHRLEETDTHVENLEAERDATRVHVRNLEAERDQLRGRLDEVERELGDTHRHVGNLDTRIASLETVEAAYRDLDAAHRGLEAAYRDLERAHQDLLASRGGRALMGYVRTKRRLLGKE